MNIGLIMSYRQGTDLLSKFRQARELELDSCQLSIWDSSLYTDEQAEIIRNAVQQTGLAISALWAGWGGPMEWNFTAGPATLGLVPVSYRSMRLNDLMLASAFAVKIGVQDIATHVGFLPENPADPNYNGVSSALRSLVRVMKERDQYFLEAFGRYVRNVHCKDGDYPTDGRNLGREKALGQGRVNLPLILKKLKALGYDRALTIEREISGPEQIRDIKAARQLLLELLDTV